MKTLVATVIAFFAVQTQAKSISKLSCEKVKDLKKIENVKNFKDKSSKVTDAIAKAVAKMNEDIEQRKADCMKQQGGRMPASTQ